MTFATDWLVSTTSLLPSFERSGGAFIEISRPASAETSSFVALPIACRKWQRAA